MEPEVEVLKMPKAAMEEWAKQLAAKPSQLVANHLMKSHRPEQAVSLPPLFPIPSPLLASWTVM